MARPSAFDETVAQVLREATQKLASPASVERGPRPGDGLRKLAASLRGQAPLGESDEDVHAVKTLATKLGGYAEVEAAMAKAADALRPRLGIGEGATTGATLRKFASVLPLVEQVERLELGVKIARRLGATEGLSILRERIRADV